jgi:hypothetical protein
MSRIVAEPAVWLPMRRGAAFVKGCADTLALIAFGALRLGFLWQIEEVEEKTGGGSRLGRARRWD